MAAKTISNLVDRAAISRRFLQIPFIERRRAHARALRLGEDRPDTRQDIIDLQGLHGLRVHGIWCTRPLPATSDEDWQTFIDEGQSAWRWEKGDVLEAEEVWGQHPEIFLRGLEEHLLDFSEAYLGERCFYAACAVKRERADRQQMGARLWHMDVEDDVMLRFIVYLTPVGEHDGAFEYIPEMLSEGVRRERHYRSGLLSEREMELLIRKSEWRNVQGDPGTACAFDGTRMFHRAGTPENGDRLSVTYTYTSRHPLHMHQSSRFRRSTRSLVSSLLNDRQRACLPPPRWF